MRALEWSLLAALAMVLAGILMRRRSRALAALALVAVLAQATLEAFRWQMVPAYALAALIIPLASVITTGERRPQLSVFGVLCGFVLLAAMVLAVALPWLFPVRVFSEPTGPFAVGTTYLHFVDASRDELFTAELGDPREIHVQAWYPARYLAGTPTEPYTRHAQAWSRGWVEGSRLSQFPFLWNHLGLVATHSVADAPPDPAARPCPLLLFSHGSWQSWKRNTGLLIELASHGYVVVALGHPFLTPFTLDASGSLVTFSREHPRLDALAREQRAASFDRVEAALERNVELEVLAPLLRAYDDLTPTRRQIAQTWARDISFVLDELARSTDEPFTQIIDPDRIGVLGFSLGGRAAGLAALQDRRIKAGINIDSWQTGHLLGLDLECPFLFLTGDMLRDANAYFFQRARAPVYQLTFHDARHANFHDMALTAPIVGKLLGKLGPDDPLQVHELAREYIRAFLDEHLRGRPSPLLTQGAAAHPGIELSVRRP